jgi:hypothetical protein
MVSISMMIFVIFPDGFRNKVNVVLIGVVDPIALTGVHRFHPQIKAQTRLRLNPCCAMPT